MSFLQTVQDPMCLNNLSCNTTDKMHLSNCIPTHMGETPSNGFSNQDHNTLSVLYEQYHNVHKLLTICI